VGKIVKRTIGDERNRARVRAGLCFSQETAGKTERRQREKGEFNMFTVTLGSMVAVLVIGLIALQAVQRW
jgi:hypothetical protein